MSQDQHDAEAQLDAAEELESTESVDVEEVEAETLDLEARVAELEKALEKSEAKVADQQDSVLRAKAEVDNIRRRAAQDVDKAKKFALEKFSNELLPVIDSMELALANIDVENEEFKSVAEGIELTLKTMMSATEKFGLTVVNPVGESFDPAKHQAMSMQESDDVEANGVIAVFQKGYELNGRLVRPAMVSVSKGNGENISTNA